MGVHVDVEPFKAKVCDGFLKGDYSGLGFMVDCEVIGVCSYEGELPTFRIRVGYGVYDYMPAHAFGDVPVKQFNCPDIYVAYSFSKNLDVPCHVICKDGSIDSGWEYRGTVDWYEDNVSAHVLQDKKGTRIVFAPNYAVLFGEGAAEEDIPKGWEKMREVWKA